MFTDALNILGSPVYLLVDKQGHLNKTKQEHVEMLSWFLVGM